MIVSHGYHYYCALFDSVDERVWEAMKEESPNVRFDLNGEKWIRLYCFAQLDPIRSLS
jgi:hypothetical protein